MPATKRLLLSRGSRTTPYACPHCAAKFPVASSLTRHVRTVHEKRSDHACPHCPSAFGAKGTLTRHIKVVHEKRRDHACPHCAGVAFGTASALKCHVSAIHLKIKRSRGAK